MFKLLRSPLQLPLAVQVVPKTCVLPIARVLRSVPNVHALELGELHPSRMLVAPRAVVGAGGVVTAPCERQGVPDPVWRDGGVAREGPLFIEMIAPHHIAILLKMVIAIPRSCAHVVGKTSPTTFTSVVRPPGPRLHVPGVPHLLSGSHLYSEAIDPRYIEFPGTSVVTCKE